MALLPSDPQHQKRMLLGIVPLLGLFLYYQMMHGKRVEAADVVQQQVEQLTATNNAARALASRGGPDLERRLAIYEQHMRQLEELIPRREEVSELLHSMSLRAQAARLDLTKMRPEANDPGPFYTRQVYEVSVKGTYHDVGRFLTDVGSLSRIVTPTDLRITKVGQEVVTRDGSPVLEANFRVVTYVIPDPTSASADTASANAR
ncbi:MAG: type 4a pilus biogenesis protein PilO [Gemmatimonadetes bacterium]|nr:type 4a pilus biogenesis protein PilO [Gemmatimonadota bacterium]